MSDLQARLLAAHGENDRAALAGLYAEAARAASGDVDREAFFLTHAYIFALDAGLPEASDLRARLVELGRETPEP